MKILYILIAIIVLLVLITVHELGHYLAGKMLKFKINEFSIGFGKALFSKKLKSGEVFSIRLVPLGGFCAFEGEDEENPTPGAFNNQKPWKRMIVLAAGVTFNFLFGVLTAAIYLMVAGYAVPEVSFFAPNNHNTQLAVGDRIVAVDGISLEAYRQFSSLTAKYKEGEEFSITVERKIDGEYELVVLDNIKKQKLNAFYFASKVKIDDKIYKKGQDNLAEEVTLDEFNDYLLTLTPTKDKDGKYEKPNLNSDTLKFYKDKDLTNEYSSTELHELVGLTISGDGLSLGFIQLAVEKEYGFFESLLKAWPFCFYLCATILSALLGLFTGATKLSDMGGTITAISQMATVTSYGFKQFLLLLPLISVNLALMNFLPIPALDGARTLFVGLEAVRGKPINRKVEGWIHTIGLFVLFGLVLFLDGYHLISGLF